MAAVSPRWDTTTTAAHTDKTATDAIRAVFFTPTNVRAVYGACDGRELK